jgi:Mg-chelatase subunit ChlD
MQVTQQPLAGPVEGNYMQDTIDSYRDIVSGRGELVYSTGPDDLVDKLGEILTKEKGNEVDLVLCLDTTGSMKDDIDSIRERLIPLLENSITSFQGFRIGMVLYKDYNDTYLTQTIPFTENFEQFQTTLNNIKVGGGRDIPEAVHEALYDGATKFPWQAESKLMVLIGDAPPHPRPQGAITKEMVDEAVIERDIKVNAIILPQ